MHYFSKNLFFLFPLCLCIATPAIAATLSLSAPIESVAQGQQFEVDVLFDARNVSYNGIEGTVTFPESLTLNRIEDGDSIVTYWITPPKAGANAITFAGIIPNGFSGVIDPFQPSINHPGTIMRLIFSSDKSGAAAIVAPNTTATRNDGNGTRETISSVALTITSTTLVAPSTIAISDTVAPTLDAHVISDPNLFDGKYALAFNATDKESGIDRVELAEGSDAFHTITSPHLLHDQTRRSILTVHAYDEAGNVTTATIVPNTPPHMHIVLIVILIGVLCILYTLIHAFRKKHHQKK